MTTLISSILSDAGFVHGFGTRRTAPDEYPEQVHILIQVHGERIVVLSEGRRTESYDALTFAQGTELVEGGGERSENQNIVFRGPAAQPFRFDEGDAMITDIPGVSIGIRTADCLPVLVGDTSTGSVAAIHCGWRSLALGLAGKGIRVLAETSGSDPASFVAATGPCIAACCCEVGEEVRDIFHDSGNDTPGLIVKRGSNLYLDLAAGGRSQLIAAGMLPQNVERTDNCTMCSRDLFWSYRGGEKEERMVSWITAK